MKQVLINQSFYLKMDALEKEDYIPSVRIGLELRKKHATGHYVYTADDIWFDAANWNAFVRSLQILTETSNSKAALSDMSDLFSITITNQNPDFNISLMCKEPIVGQKNSFIILAIEETVDAAIINSIRNSFEEID